MVYIGANAAFKCSYEILYFPDVIIARTHLRPLVRRKQCQREESWAALLLRCCCAAAAGAADKETFFIHS